MISAWLPYCLFISLLLAGAALAGERALGLYRRPVRWVWFGGMLGSLLIPSAALSIPAWQNLSPKTLPPALSAAIEKLGVDTIALGAGAGSATTSVGTDVTLAALWLLASVALLTWYALSYMRLKRERRSWSTRNLTGRTVLVSGRLGPAVTGFFQSTIVLPRWVLELEDDFRRIILLHEEEHLRAGDHRLLVLGFATLIIAPWNLPLWWQFRRLRLAVELDCDRRVLQSGTQPRVYGALLLEASRKMSSNTLLPAAFSERRAFLERRVRNMTHRSQKNRSAKLMVAAGLAAILLALACETPAPSDLPSESPVTPPAVELPAPTVDADELSERPQFTPYTVRPAIVNRGEAQRAVELRYPQELKQAGIGGTVVVFVYINIDGTVQNAVIHESSGIEELDDAASAAAWELKFIPAKKFEETVPVWMAIPITFSVAFD